MMFNYLILGFCILISLSASLYIQVTYRYYANVKLEKSISGKEVAEKILKKNKLDLEIEKIYGSLTDHYDPRSKILRISGDNFTNSSISSIAVAAHEVGHALQDETGYFFMKFRTKIAPTISFVSYIGYLAVVIGLSSSLTKLMTIGVIMEAIISIFNFITLPVEINASRRALQELKSLNCFTTYELRGVKKVLRAAAFTYVAGTLTSVLEIIRLINIRDRND